MVDFCQSPPVEDVFYLADADYVFPLFTEQVQNGITGRVHGKILPVLGTVIIAALPGKWPANHPAYSVIPCQKLPCRLADLILPLKRNDTLVHGNLHQAVRGQIDDGIASPYMLIPQHLYDLCPGCRVIPDHLCTDPAFQLFYDPRGKGFTEHFKRFLHRQPCDLEMPICRIFGFPELCCFPETPFRFPGGRKACALNMK